jgi:hypothetical protein
MVAESAAFRRWAWRLMPLGIVGVVLGLVAYFTEWKPDPLAVPEPRLVFIMDKPFFSPLRLLHFLALALAFQRLFRFIGPTIPWLTRQLSALGRNSLAVFSVGSLASLAGQLVRFFTGGGFIVDALVLSIGLGIMSFTAWFVEWRSRSRKPLLALLLTVAVGGSAALAQAPAASPAEQPTPADAVDTSLSPSAGFPVEALHPRAASGRQARPQGEPRHPRPRHRLSSTVGIGATSPAAAIRCASRASSRSSSGDRDRGHEPRPVGRDRRPAPPSASATPSPRSSPIS